MRKSLGLFVFLLFPLAASANDTAYRALQSGTVFGPTPVHDHGIHGEGEIVAVLDTGADWDSCYLSDGRGQPPVNIGLATTNVDLSRRKIVAYDFLYSCLEMPSAPGCDDPSNRYAWDNHGHGTFAAMCIAADQGTPVVHDSGDAIAPAAKLVIQDTGLVAGDACTQRPGLGCPTRDLRPVLQQAYDQGVRIHSNSWGDRQGVPYPAIPPTANYPAGAFQVDDFVWHHPDMLVVFNTGNAGKSPSSLSAPGSAKNTLQVGGFAWFGTTGEYLESYSGRGPARDGRIKPDVVGPAEIRTGSSDNDISTNNCTVLYDGGTSWAGPAIAGAAALVRQYYRNGFYPTGSAAAANAFIPSAALLKATIIASTRPVPFDSQPLQPALPAPSYDQGFGRPVLDDALYFPGDDRHLLVWDIARGEGLAAGAQTVRSIDVAAGQPLRVVLVWTDPAGNPAFAQSSPQLVNDLDLSLYDPSGHLIYGNETFHPGSPDRINNVEEIRVASPAAGSWRVVVRAQRLGAGPVQDYALVVTGAVSGGETQAVRHRAATR